MYCLGSVILSVGTNYWMVNTVVPLLFVFVYIAWYYLHSSRQIKRIEAIRCSSVYSHVSETITGLEVIRSSRMQRQFIEQFHRLVVEQINSLHPKSNLWSLYVCFVYRSADDTWRKVQGFHKFLRSWDCPLQMSKYFKQL